MKYEYLNTFIGSECRFVFDLLESSFISKMKIRALGQLILPFLVLEIYIWSFINGISFKRIYFVNKIALSDRKKLFVFSYKTCVDSCPSSIDFISSYKLVYVHLSHYMIRTAEKRNFISSVSTNVVLLGDSDFTENLYYQKYFKNFQFDVLPFRPSNRFKEIDPMHKRNRILYAGGTIHNLKSEKPFDYYSDFCNFFNQYSYHTVRSELSTINSNVIDNQHGKWDDQRNTLNGGQYYSKNLVSVFNTYTFVCYGSELSGAPSISNIEAMFCGCIPLMDSRFIKGLPFVDGIDYIDFNEFSPSLKLEIEQLILDYSNLDFRINPLSSIERFDSFLERQVRKLFL